MTKIAQYRDLSDDECAVRLEDARQELFNLRFRLATNQLDNTARLGQVKKDIARLSTLLRQREIAASESAERVKA